MVLELKEVAVAEALDRRRNLKCQVLAGGEESQKSFHGYAPSVTNLPELSNFTIASSATGR